MPLVIGQLAAELDGGVYRFAFDCIHGDHDQTVVEQQYIAGLYLTRQGFVIQAHCVDITQLGAGGVQHKFLPGLQKDLALGKLPNADLGALQVSHDGHFTACALGGFTH
jgi:hypothetical protein